MSAADQLRLCKKRSTTEHSTIEASLLVPGSVNNMTIEAHSAFLNSWVPPRGAVQAAHYVLCGYAYGYNGVMVGGISVGRNLRVT